MSRATPRRGKNTRKRAINEHFESVFNKVLASAVVVQKSQTKTQCLAIHIA
ncbi:hypothetical protein MSP8887_04197 [Marinomonas spartinae]|nr:hypothetical protein MSP8887_04197 [Marinomonas spartinae]